MLTPQRLSASSSSWKVLTGEDLVGQTDIWFTGVRNISLLKTCWGSYSPRKYKLTHNSLAEWLQTNMTWCWFMAQIGHYVQNGYFIKPVLQWYTTFVQINGLEFCFVRLQTFFLHICVSFNLKRVTTPCFQQGTSNRSVKTYLHFCLFSLFWKITLVFMHCF